MILPKQQYFFQDALKHACYSAFNATASVFLASMALNHFGIQLCVSSSDLNKTFPSKREACLPSAETIKLSKATANFSKAYLGAEIAVPFLSFTASVAAIMSIYFAKEAVRHAKAIF